MLKQKEEGKYQLVRDQVSWYNQETKKINKSKNKSIKDKKMKASNIQEQVTKQQIKTSKKISVR